MSAREREMIHCFWPAYTHAYTHSKVRIHAIQFNMFKCAHTPSYVIGSKVRALSLGVQSVGFLCF